MSRHRSDVIPPDNFRHSQTMQQDIHNPGFPIVYSKKKVGKEEKVIDMSKRNEVLEGFVYFVGWFF